MNEASTAYATYRKRATVSGRIPFQTVAHPKFVLCSQCNCQITNPMKVVLYEGGVAMCMACHIDISMALFAYADAEIKRLDEKLIEKEKQNA